jgi:hypothetical protein
LGRHFDPRDLALLAMAQSDGRWVFLSLLDNESIFLDKIKCKIAQKDDVHILKILMASKYFYM